MTGSLRKTIAAALLASAAFVAPASAAGLGDYLAATCGSNCTSTVTETAAAQENWAALKAMGTTQYIGQSYNGTTITAGSLLLGARAVGATEVDRWLTTGSASSTSVVQTLTSAMSAGSSLDVSSITGTLTGQSSSSSSRSSSSSSLQSSILPVSLTSGTRMLDPGGGGNDGYCDPAVASTQNSMAQQFINNVMGVATGSQYGFTQNGGVPISGGAHSMSGMFGGSCLDTLMQGTRDILFKPPTLSTLLSQLTSMFGTGATGCAAMPSVSETLSTGLPNGIFNSGGGFFPGFSFGESDGQESGVDLNFTNSFNLLTPTMTSASGGGTQGSVSTLFN